MLGIKNIVILPQGVSLVTAKWGALQPLRPYRVTRQQLRHIRESKMVGERGRVDREVPFQLLSESELTPKQKKLLRVWALPHDPESDVEDFDLSEPAEVE